MKRYIPYLLWLILAVGGSYFGITMYSKVSQEEWPEFHRVEHTTKSPLSPKAVIFQNRDFGWRIGDHIPLTFYIEQQPGTTVDIYSLAVEGDFEFVNPPEFEFRAFENGSTQIKVNMTLQSMSVSDELSLKGYMLYRNHETNLDHLFEIPVASFHRTDTWDGRDVIMVGETKIDKHGLMVHTLTIIFAGALIASFLFFLNRSLIRRFLIAGFDEDFNSRRLIARREFDRAWKHIEDGNYTTEAYSEVARVVRELFHLQTAGFREIRKKLGEGHPYRKHVSLILQLLAQPMYRDRKLRLEQHYRIKKLFDEMVPPSEFGEA